MLIIKERYLESLKGKSENFLFHKIFLTKFLSVEIFWVRGPNISRLYSSSEHIGLFQGLEVYFESLINAFEVAYWCLL